MQIKNCAYIFIAWCFFISSAHSQQTTISSSGNSQHTSTISSSGNSQQTSTISSSGNSQQTSTISSSGNNQGSATSTITYTNAIGIAANQVRIVNDTYDFAKCDFVAQEVCSSGGSYAQCLTWHKKQAGRLNANIISAVTVDNWNRLSHGVIADYYTCRSNQ